MRPHFTGAHILPFVTAGVAVPSVAKSISLKQGMAQREFMIMEKLSATELRCFSNGR